MALQHFKVLTFDVVGTLIRTLAEQADAVEAGR
jgi:hypothetical protein